LKTQRIIFSLFMALSLTSASAFAKPKNVTVPAGEAAMWKAHEGSAKDLDLFWGSGTAERRPIGPFTFLKENMNGTNAKIEVVDGRGQKWGVKFDDEPNSEVVGTRFLWAAGYRVEESYYVARGIVKNVTGLTRAKAFVDERTGEFTNARFKRKPGPETQSIDFTWGWDSNPFVGTKEFSGLQLANALIANSDTKVANNGVESVTNPNQTVTNWYMVSDLGGSFGGGKCGMGCSKWDARKFETTATTYLGGVVGDRLMLNYLGKEREFFQSVPVADARWFLETIGELSDKQLEDAFTAGVADTREQSISSSDQAMVKSFVRTMRTKIELLRSRVSGQ
jgi:hypothetical protein